MMKCLLDIGARKQGGSCLEAVAGEHQAVRQQAASERIAGEDKSQHRSSKLSSLKYLDQTICA